MIDNPTQLKAKVRNVSHGDNDIAKAYIRIFSWKGLWKEFRYLRTGTISS